MHCAKRNTCDIDETGMDVRSPQVRHVATWGLSFRRRDPTSLCSVSPTCGDRDFFPYPFHAVSESGAPELRGYSCGQRPRNRLVEFPNLSTSGR
jgi:hypothetical protein